MSQKVIKPQTGPQEQFLSTSADIAFYGGAAGGGKTFAMLLEPLRHIQKVDGFGAVIFRRETPMITNEGGLWDESQNIYPLLGGIPRQSPNLDWRFPPYNNNIRFAHMQYERSRHNWQSSQIPLIVFDELTQFTRKQVFYMFSRNRSACGVRPYIRGGYNPVPPDDETGGWIHEFVGWYLDSEGYPDMSKAGAVRWFVNVSDTLHWYDSRHHALEAHPDIRPLSFTYIPSSVYDNKILLQKDPDYLAKLMGLDYIEQQRLLYSNHFIREAAGTVFNREWFRIVEEEPEDLETVVRFWDLAASERKIKQNRSPATAGVKMGRRRAGVDSAGRTLYQFYVLDCKEEQFDPAKTDALLTGVAALDGGKTAVRWEEEGGASGKRDSQYIARMLSGYNAKGVRPQGDKLSRSRALAAQAYAGNVVLVRGAWNNRWLSHMHAIPEGGRWDIHDASSGAFNELSNISRGVFL